MQKKAELSLNKIINLSDIRDMLNTYAKQDNHIQSMYLDLKYPKGSTVFNTTDTLKFIVF